MEPKFGAEVFASILSIAPNKTLLRRHLNTHFVTLIGSETQHKKREVEAQPGNVPLTPNQKVKVIGSTLSYENNGILNALQNLSNHDQG